MNALERRYGVLLGVLPPSYRERRGPEILDTLLSASRPGQRWPSPREAAALVLLGWRIRARTAEAAADSNLRDLAAGPVTTVGLLALTILAASRLETWWRTGWVIVPDWLGGASMVAWLVQQLLWIAALVAFSAGLARVVRAATGAAAVIAVLLVAVDVLLASRWYVSGHHLGLALLGVTTAVFAWRTPPPTTARWGLLATGVVLAGLAVAAPDGILESGGRVGLSSPFGASWSPGRDLVLHHLPTVWAVGLAVSLLTLPVDRRPAVAVLFTAPAAVALALGAYPLGVSEFSGAAPFGPPATALLLAVATAVLVVALRVVRPGEEPAPPHSSR